MNAAAARPAGPRRPPRATSQPPTEPVATIMVLPVLASALSAAAGCISAADCSYNGNCTRTGSCTCRPQWTGPHCASLNLLPTSRSAGLHGANEPKIPANPAQAQPEHSYWGSSVLRGDDGKYHMWSAEMTQGCGIWA
jgi:hypothetical protein